MLKASLTEIGTAHFEGSDYRLVHDDDLHLTWLDYSNLIAEASQNTWQNQVNWADSLNNPGILTYTFNSGVNLDWSSSQWRLPTAQNAPFAFGYEGDPDNDGNYSYSAGYNLANSELGHLFYEELGNQSYYQTSGASNSNWGLENTSLFNELKPGNYFTQTQFTGFSNLAWAFDLSTGEQNIEYKGSSLYGIAVRSDSGLSQVPLPGAVWLLGIGMIGINSFRSRKKKSS